MIAPRTVTGQTLDLPTVSEAELAPAMAETCVRLAARRIQSGELAGGTCPDPLSRWRVSWRPDGCREVVVTIRCADDLPRETKSAVWRRLAELNHIAWEESIDSRPAWSFTVAVGEIDA